MSQISLLVRIKADTDEVYRHLTTSEGIASWFTQATYSSCEETGELRLQLWGETNFLVTEQTPSSTVIWRCTSTDNPWFGTEIKFTLKADSDQTIVVFDHSGWPEISDLFRDCAMSWAYFLESLKTWVEDGIGTPESVAPACEATE